MSAGDYVGMLLKASSSFMAPADACAQSAGVVLTSE